MFTVVSLLFFPVVLASSKVCVHSNATSTSCNDCSISYNVTIDKEIRVNLSSVSVLFCGPILFFEDVTIILMNISDVQLVSATNSTRIIGKGFSGFQIKNVSNILLVSIEIIEFERRFKFESNNDSGDIISAAMLIENSSHIKLENVSFINGSGLVMLNVGGDSTLAQCSFRNSSNSKLQSTPAVIHTGALHIDTMFYSWSSLKQIGKVIVGRNSENTDYSGTLVISGCEFVKNKNTKDVQRGGGMTILVSSGSFGNNIFIVDCHFRENAAFIGGGAYISLQQNVDKNTVKILYTNFTLNRSNRTGGGLVIGYYFGMNYVPTNNSIILSKCKFLSNEASIGGGVYTYSSPSSNRVINKNTIEFTDCKWLNNSAKSLGAALGVTPDDTTNDNAFDNKWYGSFRFKNSIFSSNSITGFGVSRGIMYVALIPVKLEGITAFMSNIGSSLDVISSSLIFESFSDVIFKNNHASLNDGAINLAGTSKILVNTNSNFTFRNNSSCAGAAIRQYSIDPEDFVFSRSCFIKYAGSNAIDINQRKISFLFENNSAKCSGFGNSIHVTTLKSCIDNNCNQNFSKRSGFACLAKFTFIGKEDRTEVSTSANKLKVTSNNNSIPVAIPGMEVDLPVYIEDELNNTISGTFVVEVSHGNAFIDAVYKHVTYNKSKLYGKPGSEIELKVTVLDQRNSLAVFLIATLAQCPPGYVLESETCKCSVYTKSKKYLCISQCNETSNTALVRQNWWMNIDKNATTSNEDWFLYSYCPKNHCYNKESRYAIVQENKTQLNDQLMCHPTRTGRLCSQCKGQKTVHYHSNSYVCGNTSTCKWGWLLYAISEILPVTCIFIVIITFNIKLTSGATNGLIYFAQTVDKIILDNVSHNLGASKVTQILFDGYTVVIQMFNLKFIQLDATSYCLWKNAQTLDMIIFRYVTTAYSLLLVIVIIVAAHYNSAWRFRKVLRKVHSDQLTARSKLLNGITGFLVLSYSGITSTSINLLLSAPLYSIGHRVKYTSVYYNGELLNLSWGHLTYAIPAILVLVTLGLLPPLLLISYPLCYKILALLKLSESKLSNFLCYIFPLEKMKPMFDSFQSSYKDRYRFFSGLNFLFRLSTIAIQAIIPASSNTTYFNVAISLQSASIFAVHTVCQPYKNKWHNIIDGLFLFDIAAIAITFSTVNIHTQESNNLGLLLFQLTLLYLPLVFMAVYMGILLWKWMKGRKCFRRKNEDVESFRYQEFNDSIILQETEIRSSGQ